MSASRRRAHRVEAAAAGIGAVVGIALVFGIHSSHSRPGRDHMAGQPVRPSRQLPVHTAPAAATPAGVVAAATTYLLALGKAAVGDPTAARSVADSVAVGPLRAQLASALPLLARSLRARLERSDTTTAFEGWPLGYRLVALNRSTATVEVWHLDIGAASQLKLMTTEYVTSAYRLRFVAGRWRIAHASSSPGPAPPPATASTREVDSFVRAAMAFVPYRYEP